jgi:hypothetical protein
VSLREPTGAVGHVNCVEIRAVVETAQPGVLILVHIQRPEVFQNFHDNVILTAKGIRIEL